MLIRSVEGCTRSERLISSSLHVSRRLGARRLALSSRPYSSSAGDEESSHRSPLYNGVPKDKLAHRDFFFDVLNVSATRRDAKQYLSRFKSSAERKTKESGPNEIASQKRRDITRREQDRLRRTGVNLGSLYAPRAIADSPTFKQHKDEQDLLNRHDAPEVHVALFSLRAPQVIDDEQLDGIALTLAQLVRLDMQIVLTFDCSDLFSENENPRVPRQQIYQQQANRIAKAIEKHNNAGARYVDAALSMSSQTSSSPASKLQGILDLTIPKLIMAPLKRTVIPLIPALAYDERFQSVPVKNSDVMLALTRFLSELDPPASTELSSSSDQDRSSITTTLDRIILIDPLGGVPSLVREDGAHVFVNLEQEYGDIVSELKTTKIFPAHVASQHLQNLSVLKSCLDLLPPATSALVISPEEAASSSRPAAPDSASVGISTRRTKNPLIHNLLTNKPVISSSLPVARLSSLNNGHSPLSSSPSRSTLVKKGMPLVMIPDPRKEPWLPPAGGEPTIRLEDHPDINFPRLLSLIEDSFRRPLDVKHYLNRIQNRIAGVIIAGEYEGGAILTWEMPSSSTEGSEDAARLVPYLDKFAVLQRSQGSSGVADTVFQAMVRSCFPNGVCWRSRKDNPVNKWYFERSKGTWKLDDSNWTMFWTTEGLENDPAQFNDYIAVCRGVQPSWADGKRPD